MSSCSILQTNLCIYQLRGLRVRPFVDAVGRQFLPILYATIGVSCYLIYYIFERLFRECLAWPKNLGNIRV